MIPPTANTGRTLAVEFPMHLLNLCASLGLVVILTACATTAQDELQCEPGVDDISHQAEVVLNPINC